MPGSHLYLDEKSVLTMSYGGENSTEKVSAYLPIAVDTLEIKSQYFVHVAGLNFITEKYIYETEFKKYADNSDEEGQYMGNAAIYENTTDFWKYMNKFPACFDMDGSFVFEEMKDDTRLPNIGNGSLPKYQLGGNINITNITDFAKQVNESGNVKLYSCTFKSGADRLTKQIYSFGQPIGAGVCYRLNVSDYFNLPLISNGNVLMDILNNNACKVRDNYNLVNYTYDYAKGLINVSNDTYGFFPLKSDGTTYNSSSLTHFFRSGYGSYNDFYNGYDDLDGKFLKVNYNENSGVATPNDANVNLSGNFVFFRGVFTPYDNGKIAIARFKMKNEATSSDYLSANFINNDPDYNHSAWRLA